MGQIDEKKIFIKLEISNEQAPAVIPIEFMILLWGRDDLVGLFLSLWFVSKAEIPFGTQPDLAEILDMSYSSYIKRRKELEDLGLIKVEVKNNNFTVLHLEIDRLWGLLNFTRGSIKIYQTQRKPKEVKENIANMRKSLLDSLQKQPFLTGQLPLSNNIYINNSLNSSNTNNTNSVKSDNSVKRVTSDVKTYPKEDYNIVLSAFKKYKGVGLAGPEVSYHMRAIKMMFQAERTVKQIVDFMKWLHDNENNEETPWVRTWTIWTVQKKIPEFLGGKLRISKTTEEEFPAI